MGVSSSQPAEGRPDPGRRRVPDEREIQVNPRLQKESPITSGVISGLARLVISYPTLVFCSGASGVSRYTYKEMLYIRVSPSGSPEMHVYIYIITCSGGTNSDVDTTMSSSRMVYIYAYIDTYTYVSLFLPLPLLSPAQAVRMAMSKRRCPHRG